MRNHGVYYFFLSVLIALPTLLSPGPARADTEAKDEDRLQSSGQVLKTIINIDDNIPESLLYKADCVVVIPSASKTPFIARGRFGRGAITCRSGEDFQGPWGAPAMMALEGGGFSTKFDARATDFVLLVMNARSASSILTSKVKLGADASVATGPLGRDAGADAYVGSPAEVLSYSRSRGVFGGISLEGSTLQPDDDANKRVYGKSISAKEIALHGEVTVPQPAQLLIDTLNQHTRKIGIASWYGGRHQGRKMANGQRFDRREFTAASWDFPLGTVVRVVNAENGDSVVVTITDRGPNHKLRRIIDLSEAAAKRLDYLEQGLTQVYLYPVSSLQTSSTESLNTKTTDTKS
jgi:SH3 domain-containing YSC84-like protein 1